MVRTPEEHPDQTTDVVVIGSGTGLVAALAASTSGADTLVLEKCETVGGTTAVSNAGIWIPNAPPIADVERVSDPELLHSYISRVAGDRARDEMIEAFLDAGPEAVRFLQSETSLTFEPRPLPDYHPEWPGGSAAGHTFAPALYDGTRLGDALADVRDNPHSPFPISSEDLAAHGGFAKLPMEVPDAEIERRRDASLLAGGRALVAGLYEACLEAGVDVQRSAAATELVRDGPGGPVCGVAVTVGEGTRTIRADAVIDAAGGIDWDEQLTEHFLRGPMTAPASPPAITGDGVRLGMDVGAKLGNLTDAWWYPTAHVGQHWPDGSPVYRMVWTERAYPGAIMINGRGERFVNESANYHDLARTFHHFDPQAYDYRNLPAYTVFDHDFREQYALFLSLTPDDPDPDWLTVADSLDGLAAAIDVPADRLGDTVDRFNRHARRGEDPDFQRGESAHDRHIGDPDTTDPSLAPLDTPPYYAFEVEPGAIGTKGGLVTTPQGAVVDTTDTPITGLYATSNATSHVMGIGYAGAGATLGPNITFAYLAGQHAATQALAD
jgi:succinate dehydrogenase/fumarate reductase flavoprotein subunit